MVPVALNLGGEGQVTTDNLKIVKIDAITFWLIAYFQDMLDRKECERVICTIN